MKFLNFGRMCIFVHFLGCFLLLSQMVLKGLLFALFCLRVYGREAQSCRGTATCSGSGPGASPNGGGGVGWATAAAALGWGGGRAAVRRECLLLPGCRRSPEWGGPQTGPRHHRREEGDDAALQVQAQGRTSCTAFGLLSGKLSPRHPLIFHPRKPSASKIFHIILSISLRMAPMEEAWLLSTSPYSAIKALFFEKK